MAKDCGCPACNPVNRCNFEYVAPRKLTLKERIHKQRMENLEASDRAFEYAKANQGRYAEHRASILAEKLVVSSSHILQSKELSVSNKLELIVKGNGKIINVGDRSDEVKCIQHALIKLNFNLGKSGADGIFGKKMEQKIKIFQGTFKPTHEVHDNYSDLTSNGVININTLLALDEALNPIIITKEMIKSVTDGLKDDYINILLNALNKNLFNFGINTKLRTAHFLSQVGHESNFENKEEQGSYSGKRMRKIFGCRGGQSNYDDKTDDAKTGINGRLRPKLWSESSKYAHNPKNLLSYVYANRKSMDNHSEESGDGYKFRGRGFIQLTGRYNYTKFTEEYKKHHPESKLSFVDDPDKVLDDIEIGLCTALFFWNNARVNKDADKDNVVLVTKKVNGGTLGLNDRKNKLKIIKEKLGL
ncbi:hypothetical protein C0W42_18355 [Photobacterium kishitanii]|uniref:peptidoglycan-binding protein n=1 Tax=Photobacterium kishitanii TaxID=318456 RepID=UPI000D4A7C26|nr:peptidoglycan-binding protein [Photobacterium kishitanii]PSU86933.1 hypothetical protein C0W42_18355 [Photobacterium kishitanii]